MFIRLIHVHQFEILYLCYGVKCQSGVNWGQKVIFTKNAVTRPCYIACLLLIRLIHVHQLETLYLLNEVKCQPGVIWGHRGRKVIFILLLLASSGNTSKTYSFAMPRPISTKLSHKNPWPMAFLSYDLS